MATELRPRGGPARAPRPAAPEVKLLITAAALGSTLVGWAALAEAGGGAEAAPNAAALAPAAGQPAATAGAADGAPAAAPRVVTLPNPGPRAPRAVAVTRSSR